MNNPACQAILTALSRHSGQLPAAAAQAFQVSPLAGDASDRQFYRVEGLAGGHTLVAMYYPPQHREALPGFLEMTAYLRGKGIPVPELRAEYPEDGVLLVEDLGDVLVEGALNPENTEVLYLAAIRLLLQMQLHCDDNGACPAFHRPFSADVFRYELNFFLTHTIKGYYQAQVTPEDERAFARVFERLASQCDVPSKVFAHRDYHSRNLLLQDGRLRLVDYQDAKIGSPLYDLVSLLKDSYIQLSEPLVKKLFNAWWHEGGRRLFPAETRGEVWEQFDTHALQRNLKAAGSFGYLVTQKGKPRYAESLPGTWGYIRSNLDRHPEWQDLRTLLGRYVPEFSGGGL